MALLHHEQCVNVKATQVERQHISRWPCTLLLGALRVLFVSDCVTYLVLARKRLLTYYVLERDSVSFLLRSVYKPTAINHVSALLFGCVEATDACPLVAEPAHPHTGDEGTRNVKRTGSRCSTHCCFSVVDYYSRDAD
jgi:hypothetical protein